MCHQIGTQDWWKRAFFGFVSMCETNAFLAYKRCQQNITRLEWREKLAYALVRFGGFEPLLISPSDTEKGHNYTKWYESKKKCVICKTPQKSRCECGVAVCGSQRTTEGCFIKHVLGVTTKPKSARKRARVELENDEQIFW